jgi:hypothetical protein
MLADVPVTDDHPQCHCKVLETGRLYKKALNRELVCFFN